MRRGLFFQLALLFAAASVLAVTPGDLRRVEDQWSVELVTMGRTTGKPRPTTIWFVHENGIVWVQSGKGGETNWYRNLLKNPEVTLRFEGLTVPGRARPIDDPAETERVHELFLGKYWTARISGWLGGGFGTGKVVHIEPVTSARSESGSRSGGEGESEASPPGLPPE